MCWEKENYDHDFDMFEERLQKMYPFPKNGIWDLIYNNVIRYNSKITPL